ncbi:MAG: RHS repeat-associated core domain-containing protein, partial [Pyrinomonadaceae bacterium]
ERSDSDKGQSNTLWRKYDPNIGRWSSPDPYHGSMSIADPQSFNRYAYVGNDPINNTDPTGLFGFKASPPSPPINYGSGRGGGIGTSRPGITLREWDDVHNIHPERHLGNTSTSPAPPAPNPTPQTPTPVKIVDTGGDTALEQNRGEVLSRIDHMTRSQACSDAFARAGLPTPAQVVQNGLTIASPRALTDSSYNGALGITENARNFFRNNEAPAQTIQGKFTTSGRPVIILSADAFNGSFLNEAIPHEFIHAAGFGTQPSFGYSITSKLGIGSDLGRYPHYQDIISNCRSQ